MAERAEAFPRTEVANVVRDQEVGPRTDRRGHDGDVFRVGQGPGAFVVPRGGVVDPDGKGAQELFEEKGGLRKLRARFWGLRSALIVFICDDDQSKVAALLDLMAAT